MRGWNPRSWRLLLVPLLLPIAFVVVKIVDPTSTDRALLDLSRRWVCWGLTQVYPLFQDEPRVVVGLFDDTFKKISKQPPKLADYAIIIKRLLDLDAREIVVDMDMRIEGDNHDLEDALEAASRANVPVILPFLPNDDIGCLEAGKNFGAQRPHSIACAAAGLGAVQFGTDDTASYYPLYVLLEDEKTLVPSLGWAAYLHYTGRTNEPSLLPGLRDELRDDMFTLWRKPIFPGKLVFCGFPVTQLFDPSKIDIAASGCPHKDSRAGTEAPGNVPIRTLIKGKVVLIGQSGQSNEDWVDPPFRGRQPGVMFHATALDELLRFGGTGYPVNRDDALMDMGSFEVTFSSIYLLFCLLLPPLIELAGMGMMNLRRLQKIGTWVASNPLKLGAFFALSLIPALPNSLSTLNALSVFTFVYVIVGISSSIERWISVRRGEGHA